MSKIFELKAKRAAAQSEYRALINKEADLPTDESLPTEDVSRLASLEKDIAVLDARVARLEAVEAMTVTTDTDSTDDKSFSPTGKSASQFTPVSEHRTFAQAATPVAKGLRAGRYVMGAAYALKHGVREAQDMISKTFNDDLVAKTLSVSSTGATTIPVYFAQEIIEQLRPLVAVRNAGARVIDTTGGNLTIPRLATTSTANWGTENQDIVASNATVDTITLSNYKLTGMTSLSNDLIRRSPLGMDQIVADDLVQVMARAEDLAFLTGAGSGSLQPLGLKNVTGIQYMYAGGADLANATIAINACVTKLQMSNTRMISPCWIMTPQVKNFLANLRDNVGNFFVFAAELAANTLRGYPVVTTTQLPNNLTNYIGGSSGTAGTDIFLADFADVLIGDTLGIQLELSKEASFVQAGSLISAFSKDLTVFRVIKETDLALRHPTSVMNLRADSWKLY